MDIICYTKEIGLTYYAAHVHHLNRRWWYTEEGQRLVRSHPQMNALVMSELGEALEGLRKDSMDNHLPQFPSPVVEMADVAIRLLDYVGSMSIRIDEDYLIMQGDDPSEEIWNMMKLVADIPGTPLGSLGDHVSFIIASCEAFVRTFYQEDFWRVVFLKLQYNQNRDDHTYAARAAENGKKF